MITGIRSAIVCDTVERGADGRVNYIGLWTDPLLADSRPGLLNLNIALQVTVDERRSAGHLSIETDGFELALAFGIPAGCKSMELSSPFIIPVLKDGLLTVCVFDDESRGEPFRASWSLGFLPDAENLGQAAAEEFVAAAKRAAVMLAEGSAARTSKH